MIVAAPVSLLRPADPDLTRGEVRPGLRIPLADPEFQRMGNRRYSIGTGSVYRGGSAQRPQRNLVDVSGILRRVGADARRTAVGDGVCTGSHAQPVAHLEGDELTGRRRYLRQLEFALKRVVRVDRGSGHRVATLTCLHKGVRGRWRIDDHVQPVGLVGVWGCNRQPRGADRGGPADVGHVAGEANSCGGQCSVGGI